MSLRFIAMLMYTPIAMVMGLVRPLWGVYALMVMYYFRPDVWNAPSWWQPVYWITLSCIVGWALHAKDLRVTGGLVVSAIFLLGMVVSSLTAWMNTDVSFSATVVILKLVVVQFLLVQLIRDIKTLNQFLWVNVFGNLWTLKTAVILTLSGSADRVNVGAGQGGGANYLAMLFVMSIPLFYFKYMNGKKWEKKWSLILAPFYLFSIIGTKSRGGLLCLFAIMFFLIVRSNKKLQGFVLMFVLSGLIALMMPQSTWDRFSTTFDSEEKRGFAAQSRILLWKAGGEMFAQSPVTGVGHDNFQILSPRYVGFFAGDTPKPYDPALEATHQGFVAHNTFVQMAADGGLICLVPFTLLFIMSIATLRRARRIRVQGREKRDFYVYSQILEGLMWAFIIGSMFGSHMKFDFLWWYFGAISAFGYIATERDAVLRREEARRGSNERGARWGMGPA